MGLGSTKRLREPIRQGETDCTVRILQSPRVKVGGSYAMKYGEAEVTAMRHMALLDITLALARRSGFASLIDLLKVAKNAPGE